MFYQEQKVTQTASITQQSTQFVTKFERLLKRGKMNTNNAAEFNPQLNNYQLIACLFDKKANYL